MVLVLICPCTSRAFLRFFPRDVARGACSKGRARHYLNNAAPTAMIQCPKFLGPAIAPCRAGWGSPVVAHSFDHPLGSSWLVNKSDPSLEQFHRLGSIDVVEVDATFQLQSSSAEIFQELESATCLSTPRAPNWSPKPQKGVHKGPRMTPQGGRQLADNWRKRHQLTPKSA